MSRIMKLIGLWAFSKRVSTTTPVFMHLLLGMAMLSMLAVMAAILLAIFIGGGLWFTYEQLLVHGVEPIVATMILGAIIIALIGSIALIARGYWRKIRMMFKQILYLQSPVSGRVSSLANAFMDGFLSPAPRR